MDHKNNKELRHKAELDKEHRDFMHKNDIIKEYEQKYKAKQ